MRFAYADPPYPGKSAKHYAGREVNHRLLLARLNEFDAWALSTNSTTLQDVLSICPAGVRIAAWVKTYAVLKPHVFPQYAWEPVIFSGGRNRFGEIDTPRDWLAARITAGKGMVGVKPTAFSFWLFDLVGLLPDDELVDMFPGVGAVGEAFDLWSRSPRFDAVWSNRSTQGVLE